MPDERWGIGLSVPRPLRKQEGGPLRESAAEKYSQRRGPASRPELSSHEIFPWVAHPEGAELYAVSELPSAPDTTVKYLFAAPPREPLQVSQLLAAYPGLKSVVVRTLHADVPLGAGLTKLFIFDNLAIDDRSFMRQVTHLHIDVAAAHTFHELCKVSAYNPRQTFVALRFFSIAMHIEDANAGHYDALIGAVVGCNAGFDSALVHIFYGSAEDPLPAVEPSVTFGAIRHVQKPWQGRVYHVLRHARYRRDALHLWRRDAWGDERGVWHNEPPAHA